MTANIQISGKSNSGVIFVVGGDTFDDFHTNLLATLNGDLATTDAVVAEAARLIVPTSVGGQSAPQEQQFQQAVQTVTATFPGTQPVQQFQPAGPPLAPQQVPLCPNHQQPAKYVPPGVSKATGKPYQGFWSCASSDRSCKVR